MTIESRRAVHCLHVITGLGTGGAEMMLYKLVTHGDPARLRHTVVSLGSSGPVGERMRDAGVSVTALGMSPGYPDPRKLLRLAGLIREESPDVVQAWMYHANLLGGIASRLAGRRPTLWNIRASNLESGEKRATRMLARLCGPLSRMLCDGIVTNARAAREVHVALGYPRRLFHVVPNGFDVKAFRPDPAARESVRRELGIALGARLVGIVARRHPMKDHENFLAAAALISRMFPGIHFLMAGDGVTMEDAALRTAVEAGGLGDRVHLLGARRDTPRLLASLDLYVSSSSYGEAFPNVLGEAMSCGVPCVSTDVGDSAFIIGEHGRTVPPRRAQALADGCNELLGMDDAERRRLGAGARERVREHFAIEHVAAEYERLYTGLRH